MLYQLIFLFKIFLKATSVHQFLLRVNAPSGSPLVDTSFAVIVLV